MNPWDSAEYQRAYPDRALAHVAREAEAGQPGRSYCLPDQNYLREVVRLARIGRAAELANEPRTVECPNWAPGRITLRVGCSACAAEARDRAPEPHDSGSEGER